MPCERDLRQAPVESSDVPTPSPADLGRRLTRVACHILLAIVLSGCDNAEPARHVQIHGGSAERGRAVIVATGCGVCHAIPGVPGAIGTVGPPLIAFGDRSLIAGRLPNRPATLVAFLRDAPSLVPETGMPVLPLSGQEARDIATFLYTLR